MTQEQRIGRSVDRHPAGSGTLRRARRGRELTTAVARKVRNAAVRLESHRVHTNDSSNVDEAMFWRLLHLELERARRHERSFVIASIQCDSVETAQDAAQRIRATIRFEDEVLARRDRVLVMLSEVGPDLAAQVFARVAHEVPVVGARELAAVSFPDDTLTYHDLVRHVLHGHHVTPIRLAG